MFTKRTVIDPDRFLADYKTNPWSRWPRIPDLDGRFTKRIIPPRTVTGSVSQNEPAGCESTLPGPFTKRNRSIRPSYKTNRLTKRTALQNELPYKTNSPGLPHCADLQWDTFYKRPMRRRRS